MRPEDDLCVVSWCDQRISSWAWGPGIYLCDTHLLDPRAEREDPPRMVVVTAEWWEKNRHLEPLPEMPF